MDLKSRIEVVAHAMNDLEDSFVEIDTEDIARTVNGLMMNRYGVKYRLEYDFRQGKWYVVTCVE